MKQFEINVMKSFQLAKRDMHTLFDHINVLYDEIKMLKSRNASLADKVANLSLQSTRKQHARVVRRVTKTAKRFVASKAGSKFHSTNCAFGKNMKPKNKQVFASKNTALNKGLKKCSCVAW